MKGLLLTGFGLACLLVALFTGIAYRSNQSFLEADKWVNHTHEVLIEVERLQSAIKDAETGARGYVITAQESFLQSWVTSGSQIESHLGRLCELTVDNPRQVRRLEKLAPLLREKSVINERQIALRRNAGLDAAAKEVGTGKGKLLMDEIRHLAAEMTAEETALLKGRAERSAGQARQTQGIYLGLVALLVTLLAAIFALIMRHLGYRRRSEEERDRYFTASLDLIAIASLDGYFKRVNPAWERVLGWSAAELTSKPWLEFVHPEDQAATAAEGGNLSRGVSVLTFENRYAHRDGSYRWLSWRVPAPEPGSSTLYASARDITDLKEATRKIQELNLLLEDKVRQVTVANQELESFSYSVSHDLRAPLRHVQGFVQLLEKHAGVSMDEKSRQLIATIAKSGRKMGCLIDDLLEFSRMGRVEMRRSKVSLGDLVRQVQGELEKEAEGRHVEWTLGTLPEVQGDPSLLRQVLTNLLSNALKYTRLRDPARIEIGSKAANGEGTTFFVRDNGAGFDMSYKQKLFGVFQRLHRAEDFEGTGIGLANVKRIIERHGGEVWAEGKVDEGAVFYFTLGGTT